MDREPFAKVHVLMKNGKLASALRSLIDTRSNVLREIFTCDRNHAWYCIGDIYFRQQKYELAKKAFKKSLVYRPDDGDALMAVGNCYDAVYRPRMAERYFRRALNSYDHEFTKKIRAGIRFNLANALLDQGRVDEAITIFDNLTTDHFSIRRSARINLNLAQSRRNTLPPHASTLPP